MFWKETGTDGTHGSMRETSGFEVGWMLSNVIMLWRPWPPLAEKCVCLAADFGNIDVVMMSQLPLGITTACSLFTGFKALEVASVN